jgi:hypothetical protein
VGQRLIEETDLQMGFNTDQDFLLVEGFNDVINTSSLESQDDRFGFMPGRDEDNRNGFAGRQFFKLTARFESSTTRQVARPVYIENIFLSDLDRLPK